MKNIKKQGISLIVLVITIIIMIILAAAIMLTLSNTGIIGQAEKATNEYSKKDATTVLESALALLKKDKYTNKEITFNDAYIDSELKEQDMIANGNIVIVGPWMYVIDREKLVIVSGPEKANLNEGIQIEATASTTDYINITMAIKVTYTGSLSAVKIKGPSVDESLTLPTPVDGVYNLTTSVTENGSYVITAIDEKDGTNLTTVLVHLLPLTNIATLEDFILFRNNVNAGMTYEGKTVTIENDINLNGSESNQWIPIGTSTNPFKGTFNGNGKTIKGLYINATTGYQGLFGYSTGTIKNVTVEGSIKSTAGEIGGICGYSTGTFEYCINKVKIECSTATSASGIVASYKSESGKIQYCANLADITAGHTIGGIVGYSYGSISNISDCYNKGNITALSKQSANQSNIGGIVAVATEGDITVTNCYNIGSVTAVGMEDGGIIGNSGFYKSCSISNCYNIGNISSQNQNYVGSIVGGAGSSSTAVSNSYWTTTQNCKGNGSSYITSSKKITSAELMTYASTLGDAFTSDIKNTNGTWKYNNGYPILKWQLD